MLDLDGSLVAEGVWMMGKLSSSSDTFVEVEGPTAGWGSAVQPPRASRGEENEDDSDDDEIILIRSPVRTRKSGQH